MEKEFIIEIKCISKDKWTFLIIPKGMKRRTWAIESQRVYSSKNGAMRAAGRVMDTFYAIAPQYAFMFV